MDYTFPTMGPSREESCLYAVCYAPRERIEPLLGSLVRPIATEIHGHPDLDSLFFVRSG